MKPLKRATVPSIEPLFFNLDDAARFSGIAKKTLQNRLSLGQLPVKVRYLGAKPLIEAASLREALENLPSEPLKKRGRKRLSEGLVNSESTPAGGEQ